MAGRVGKFVFVGLKSPGNSAIATTGSLLNKEALMEMVDHHKHPTGRSLCIFRPNLLVQCL